MEQLMRELPIDSDGILVIGDKWYLPKSLNVLWPMVLDKIGRGIWHTRNRITDEITERAG